MQKYECTWEKLDKGRNKGGSGRNLINAGTSTAMG
jgi:hypothetical protein